MIEKSLLLELPWLTLRHHLRTILIRHLFLLLNLNINILLDISFHATLIFIIHQLIILFLPLDNLIQVNFVL